MDSAAAEVVILDPRDEGKPVAVSLAPRPESLEGKRLGLLSNRKPNARELLHLVATLAGERFHLQDVFYIEKETHRRVAPPEIIQQLALRCDVAIVAAAD